jgi:hypothetical protein
MITYLTDKIKWSYRKNSFDLQGYLLSSYPDFILAKNPHVLGRNIPVFVFHSVDANRLAEQLGFLRENNYHACSADELHAVITGRAPARDNSVVLTFDDGLGSLWSIAYPLLKKFGFQAVSFLIPGLIQEGSDVQPNLEDVWSNDVLMSDVAERDYSQTPLSTWKEIEIMHKSRVIDFQAHTMYHNLIFTGPRVVDFIHPGFNCYRFGNINVPTYREAGADNNSRTVKLGMPLYQSEPFLSGKLRFYDAEDARIKCVEYVQEHGGQSFFAKSDWRNQLYSFFKKIRAEYIYKEYYETRQAQSQAVKEDLSTTKQIIERRLNKTVGHLCYPWYIGSQMAVEMGKQAGYLSNYWGHLRDVRINCQGKDPFRISRLEDIYIFRLPGKNRKSLQETITCKFNAVNKLESTDKNCQESGSGA